MAGTGGPAPAATYPGDGDDALRFAARALTEGMTGGVLLALLGGAVLGVASGGTPLVTVAFLPLSALAGLVLGLLLAAAALVLLAVELAFVRRTGRRLRPLALAAGPAVVVALAGGVSVRLLFAGLDGDGSTATVLALVATVGGGALVLWRATVLLPGRGFAGVRDRRA